MRGCRTGVLVEGPAEAFQGLRMRVVRGGALVLAGEQAMFVAAQGGDLLVPHPLQLRLLDLHRDGSHDGLGRLLLERGQLVPVALVALAPDLPLRRGVDQSNRHTQSVAGASDAALDRVAGTELAQPSFPGSGSRPSAKDVCRARTPSRRKRARSAMTSSVSAAGRLTSVWSSERSRKGRTATRGLPVRGHVAAAQNPGGIERLRGRAPADLAHGPGELLELGTRMDLEIPCQAGAELTVASGRERTLALRQVQPHESRMHALAVGVDRKVALGTGLGLRHLATPQPEREQIPEG